ncbi:MAG: transporter substrate-binding domain-containing protein [Rhizobiales bacterium]|nr:transporter substrate-binding domain-containing protein [Hyphomicrobiales bacterium]OJX99007.1 MAG: ABC transporter substrate-binding protein [Rhizobiales bacterium 63-22]
MRKWALGFAVLAFAAMTASASNAEETVLKIATEGAFPPFNLTKPDGTLDGYEIDLGKDLCNRMKVKCEFVSQDWDGIIPALQAKKFDVIMDGMSITPEREKLVSFSIPYQLGLMGFGAMAGTPVAKLPGTGDSLNIAAHPAEFAKIIEKWKPILQGKVVGVQAGTSNVAFLEKYLKGVVEVREYPTTGAHDLDLLSGRIDAVFAAYPSLMADMEKPEFKDMKIVGTGIRGDIFGKGAAAAFRKSDTDLKNRFDKAIQAAIDDGTVKKLSIKWFKSDQTPSNE